MDGSLPRPPCGLRHSSSRTTRSGSRSRCRPRTPRRWRMSATDAIPIATGERAHTVAKSASSSKRGIADVVKSISRTSAASSASSAWLAGLKAHYLLMAPHNVCVSGRDDGERPFRNRDTELQGSSTSTTSPMSGSRISSTTRPQVAVEDGLRSAGASRSGLKLNHEACRAHPRTGGTLKLFEAGWEKRAGQKESKTKT